MGDKKNDARRSQAFFLPAQLVRIAALKVGADISGASRLGEAEGKENSSKAIQAKHI